MKLLELRAMTMKILHVTSMRAATLPFEEGYITLRGAGRLFLRVPELGGAARAEVLLTHGLGEHSARYAHVAEAFAESGLRLWAYDLHGHGRSGGRRGDAPDYATFLDDLAAVLEQIPREAPLFLLGHSLGGQITLNFLLERGALCQDRCRGVVAASPWLRLAFEPSRWRLLLAAAALRIWPSFRQRRPNDRLLLSRDLAHLDALAAPELMYHRISARLFSLVVKAGEAALAAAPRLRTPLLLIHGGDDRVTSREATEEFEQAAGATDKTLKIYPESRHETFNDFGRERVLKDVIAWIDARLVS